MLCYVEQWTDANVCAMEIFVWKSVNLNWWPGVGEVARERERERETVGAKNPLNLGSEQSTEKICESNSHRVSGHCFVAKTHWFDRQ